MEKVSEKLRRERWNEGERSGKVGERRRRENMQRKESEEMEREKEMSEIE